MNIEKMNVGDCYIYKTNKNKMVGFILISKVTTESKIDWVKFGTIVFKNETTKKIEDFKKGELFTHKVYSGLEGDYENGIQGYEFNTKAFEFLVKFQYVGNLKLNKSKYTYGGGGVFSSELIFNLDLNSIEFGKEHYQRQSLEELLK
jgi:hypothetical protein